MDITAIKKLYEDAATLHGQATGILKEFEGKEMPKEKATEVDGLLDKVEAKTAEAKRLERAAEADKFLNEPVTGKRFFTPQPETKAVKVMWQGRELNLGEIAELKTLAPHAAFISDGSTDAYISAFRAYIRKGLYDLTPQERKDLSVGDATAGGYLVRDTVLAQLLVTAREMSTMRRICNVLPPVPSGSLIVPSEESIFSDAEWVAEIQTATADTVAPFGRRTLVPHALSKLVKISNTLLRSPTFDAEAYVRDRIAYKFGVTQENGFINGPGAANQPQGLLLTPSLPTYTTAAALTVTADDIINWVYRLPAAYAGRPSTYILCNRAFIRKVRLLKDGMGNYIWQPGLSIGSPNMIMDTQYALSDRFDDGLDGSDAWEASAKIAVIGDFSYYWIVDALNMSIQRLIELYAATNQVGYIGRMESDGQAVLTEPFLALVVHS